MSTLKINNAQIGQSATATNNFTWYQPASPDGTVRLGVGNAGATSADAVTVNSSGNVGIGVTPFANTIGKSLDFVGGAGLFGYSNRAYLSGNAYFDGGWKYKDTNASALYGVNDTNGQHRWYTAPSGTAGTAITFTQAMTLDASGNLCVGSTSPGNAGTLNLSVGSPGTTVGGLQLWSTTSATHYVQFGDSASGGAPYSGAVGYNHSSDAMVFYSNAAERMRIDSSGNVGIGTSSPSKKLSVNGDIRLGDAGGTGAIFTDASNGLRIMLPAVGTSTTEAMRIDSSGNVGIGTNGSYNRLSSVVSATGAIPTSEAIGVSSGNANTPIGEWNQSDSATFSGIALETRTTGASRWLIANQWTSTYLGDLLFVRRTGGTSSAEAMRINSNGNLLIGCATEASNETHIVLSTNSGTTRWSVGPWSSVSNNFYITATSASQGVYLSGTTATSWSALSDERWKTELQPIENAAEKVSTLRAVTGVYTNDADKRRKPFLIAQDVLAVLPEAVDTENPNKYGLAYTEVIPLLVAAIKEQQEQINQLKAEVAALKGN